MSRLAADLMRADACIAEQARRMAEIADTNRTLATENEVLRAVVAKLTPTARGVWSPNDDEHIPYVVLGVRTCDLTADETAVIDDTATEETNGS